MPTATITAKGQITIPKAIREALELDRGDRVSFVLRDDGVVELRPENEDVMELFGIIKPEVRGVSIEDMNEAIATAAAET